MRRAVVGRVGTSKPTIDVGIAVGGTASRLCGKTVRELRRAIYGDVLDVKPLTA
jgi:hypothetical protein